MCIAATTPPPAAVGVAATSTDTAATTAASFKATAAVRHEFFNSFKFAAILFSVFYR